MESRIQLPTLARASDFAGEGSRCRTRSARQPRSTDVILGDHLAMSSHEPGSSEVEHMGSVRQYGSVTLEGDPFLVESGTAYRSPTSGWRSRERNFTRHGAGIATRAGIGFGPRFSWVRPGGTR